MSTASTQQSPSSSGGDMAGIVSCADELERQKGEGADVGATATSDVTSTGRSLEAREHVNPT